MNGLLSTKSYNFLVPIKNDPTMRPLWIVFLAFVTQPFFTKSTTPSANISEWIPRSLWLCKAFKTASGIFPIPNDEKNHSLDTKH